MLFPLPWAGSLSSGSLWVAPGSPPCRPTAAVVTCPQSVPPEVLPQSWDSLTWRRTVKNPLKLYSEWCVGSRVGFFLCVCGKRACGFSWFSEGSMTQGYGLGCFRHYSVGCSPVTDEEMGFLNLISCSQLLLLVLEREQPSLRTSPTRSFRYCPCAVDASWRGQAAGWGVSPAFFREKWRVPKEGRAGPSPKVSWTMSVLYMNWGHVRRVDPRMTPDNPQNDSFLFFLRLDRFGETTWLSQICTLNPGPNSFQAFLKLRIWIDKRR